MGRYLDLAAGGITGLDTVSQCEKSELSEIRSHPLILLLRFSRTLVQCKHNDPIFAYFAFPAPLYAAVGPKADFTRRLAQRPTIAPPRQLIKSTLDVDSVNGNSIKNLVPPGSPL